MSRSSPSSAIPQRATLPLPLLFGATILASSCLLFLVQPLASKLILPWFGGSAAVWTTCMLFFQMGLLLGYCYAHGVARNLAPQRQMILHTAILVLSLAALPILPNAAWQPHPGEDPTLRVFAVLAMSAGLPYLLLSSTSPLIQSWYARTNLGALPYRYFALSNAGSLLALLAYPILVEPYLTGHEQAWMWSLAYALFAVLCIATAVRAGRALPGNSAALEREDLQESSPVGLKQVALWLSLAACASTLLLAVTNMLTQNIAPMPFLWVLPLSLYLLTFILCFESDRWYRRLVFLPLVLPSLWCLAEGAGPLRNSKISLTIPLLCAALFVCCMACHGELARLRPPAHQLTTYYLMLAAGGTLGGLFVALFAPHVFPAMYEYPIAFVGCAVLLSLVVWPQRANFGNPTLAALFLVAAIAGTICLAGYASRGTWREIKNAKFLGRNFYGALRVRDMRNDYYLQTRELSHGTIIHGIQFLDAKMRRQPTTYYALDSGVGLTWRTIAPKGPIRMGVVGLGAGTLAAYGRAGDFIRFYDINPLVLQIATTQFTYLSDCPAEHEVSLGDARLVMAQQDRQRFDILVIDAFSGDAIPVHLLTREAFQIYWRHLKPDGVLVVHVSNRYLDLNPVVALAAKEIGKPVWDVDGEEDEKLEAYASSYVLVTSRPGFFSSPLLKGELLPIPIPGNMRAWTDDYSNLLQVLKFK